VASWVTAPAAVTRSVITCPARQNADEADKSAAAAQASAKTASAAAATAHGAARSANYSANKAIDAARSALNSSYSAHASASSARQAAIAAGQDAKTAAAAASDARRIATEKRKAEAAEAARQAAEEAKKNRENGSNPADSPTHDQVNPNGSNGGGEDWWSDAGWYASAFNNISIAAGFISAGLGIASLAFPLLAPAAGVFAYISLGAAGLSTVFTGIEYGFTSGEFASSAGSTALGLLTFGQSKWIGALSEVGGKVVAPVATKVTQFAHDLVSPITGVLSLF
jgi:hypothetical protein